MDHLNGSDWHDGNGRDNWNSIIGRSERRNDYWIYMIYRIYRIYMIYRIG